MTTVIEKPARPECPRCQSHHVYNRLKPPSYRCQQCGHTWPAAPEPTATP